MLPFFSLYNQCISDGLELVAVKCGASGVGVNDKVVGGLVKGSLTHRVQGLHTLLIAIPTRHLYRCDLVLDVLGLCYRSKYCGAAILHHLPRGMPWLP